MSHTLATPPPATSARGLFRRLWAEPESRSILIGALGVLLIHLLIWIVAPHLVRLAPTAARPPQSTARQFSIELAPDTFTKAPPKPNPSKFVEANPDAPENTPDKTDNFSDRNQQVAQEKPTPDGKSDRPATEGKKDFESNQIVSGQLTQPTERIEAVPPAEIQPTETTVVTPPKTEQNPLPGFEKREGESKDSFGSNVARVAKNIQPVPNRVEGMKDAPLIEGATSMQPAIDPKRPRPRPQMVATQQVRPAVLAQNDFGTKNIGNIAYDSRWSAYGEYLRRLIDSVQIQWERILVGSSVMPPSGTFVAVKFILNSQGNISQIVNVDSHTSRQGESSAVSAITDRAPYGVWTDDMKAMLGEQQELTFTFYYQ